MNHQGIPGSSLLTTLLGWIALLMIGAVALQVLVAELVRWITILAPWLLLLVVIAAGVMVMATVVRRRRYSY